MNETERRKIIEKRERVSEEEKKKRKEYTFGEEVFNSVTHGIGILLSIAGMALLVARAARYGDNYHIVSYAIFGGTMIFMYLASTLHHSLSQATGAKVFKILDHSAIFVLIAGTYTPISIGLMRGTSGWVVFGIVWGLTVVGILIKSLNVKYYARISTLMYILMGWMIVFTFGKYTVEVPRISVILLLAGGASYTVGCLFYAVLKFRYMHSIWHFFVLGGTICHFLSMFFAIPYTH